MCEDELYQSKVSSGRKIFGQNLQSERRKIRPEKVQLRKSPGQKVQPEKVQVRKNIQSET